MHLASWPRAIQLSIPHGRGRWLLHPQRRPNTEVMPECGGHGRRQNIPVPLGAPQGTSCWSATPLTRHYTRRDGFLLSWQVSHAHKKARHMSPGSDSRAANMVAVPHPLIYSPARVWQPCLTLPAGHRHKHDRKTRHPAPWSSATRLRRCLALII